MIISISIISQATALGQSLCELLGIQRRAGQTGAWEQKGVWPLPLNFRLLLQEGSGREQGISPPAAAHHLLPTGPTNGDPLVSCPTPVLLMGTGWRPAQKYVQVSADCCVRGFRASWTERLVHIQPLDIS